MDYVVTVEFDIHPRHVEAFLALAHENARHSLDSEPGCRQFDVCFDPARANTVFLYEVYLDRMAFDSHLASPHFHRFDTAVHDMVAAKTVRTLQRMSLRGKTMVE
jgi:quinol monooxygenase YgiN